MLILKSISLKYSKHLMFLFLCITISSINLYSQDIHFSQFDKTPLNTNPSFTGLTECDYRIVANHRNQWQSITTPYKTYSFSFDMPFYINTLRKGFFGLGAVINNDIAGDSELSTSQFELNGAFHYRLSKDSSSIISLGISNNFNQKSINYQNLRFGSQYDGYQYNSSLGSGEQFSENNLQYIDFNLGANIFQKFEKNIFVLGISYYHLNAPKQSYYLDKEIKLDRLLSFQIFSEIFISEQLYFLPSVFIMRQGKYRENTIGGILKYNTNNLNFKTIYLGSHFRVKDAYILRFGFDYQNINFNISYDINYSNLRVASNGRGAIELSIIYNICKKHPYIFKPYNQCPTYL